MNKNNIIALALVLIVILLGVKFLGQENKETETTKSFVENTNPEQTPTGNPITTEQIQETNEKKNIEGSVLKTYTLEQVATHGDKSSCWSVVNGNVYDLTTWINKHPGGEKAILSICGKDGTEAFTGKHAGQDRPEQALASFQIGTLAK